MPHVMWRIQDLLILPEQPKSPPVFGWAHVLCCLIFIFLCNVLYTVGFSFLFFFFFILSWRCHFFFRLMSLNVSLVSCRSFYVLNVWNMIIQGSEIFENFGSKTFHMNCRIRKKCTYYLCEQLTRDERKTNQEDNK